MPLVIPSGTASIAQIFVDAWALPKLHRHTQLSERTILINLAKIADSTVSRPSCALPRMVDTDLTAQPVLHSSLRVSTQRDLVSRCAALCAHMAVPTASALRMPLAKTLAAQISQLERDLRSGRHCAARAPACLLIMVEGCTVAPVHRALASTTRMT